MSTMNRRRFLRTGGALLAASSLPFSLVKIAFGKAASEDFTFAYVSDSHITQIKGKEFVRNWDRGLIRAVAETNLLDPRPDFIFYGGDIAQLGKPEEIDHGLEILGGLRGRCALRHGRARLLPRPGRALARAARTGPLQFRSQGCALRGAEQHPHLRRLDL